MEDRWRIGFPEWDRYGKGHPRLDDYPYEEGHWWDPYHQNVLKGDYPILGQNTFLNLSGTSLSIFDLRQLPTGTLPRQGPAVPAPGDFFPLSNQFLYRQFFRLSAELFHGDAGFKPVDWRVRITPVFNINYLSVHEQTITNPDQDRNLDRGRTFFALEEWFVERKLADLSPDYDFLSVRLGSQFFASDFRGFIFTDVNRAVRLFGSLEANRDQFNLAYFNQAEKDTNSDLNTFSSRGQDIVIANFYRQDFLWPGYMAEWSVHYNHDTPNIHIDQNNAVVRPNPVGPLQPHEINAVYLGWAGNGHIERFNVSNAFYWALGHDSLNPLAGRPQDINAQMVALELSYDRDWARFRTSFLWFSGDHDPNDGQATGFDSIFDNTIFAGAPFSYWWRQPIRFITGTLVNKESLLPDLRSKTQGESNFVNPGLVLLNFGVDLDITPRWRWINNVNLLWFDTTAPLEKLLVEGGIHRFIGTDLSTGVDYRPLLNNNVIVRFGIAALIPGQGFEDIYNPQRGNVNPLLAGFMDLTLSF
jgi:hypothetical protein